MNWFRNQSAAATSIDPHETPEWRIEGKDNSIPKNRLRWTLAAVVAAVTVCAVIVWFASWVQSQIVANLNAVKKPAAAVPAPRHPVAVARPRVVPAQKPAPLPVTLRDRIEEPLPLVGGQAKIEVAVRPDEYRDSATRRPARYFRVPLEAGKMYRFEARSDNDAGCRLRITEGLKQSEQFSLPGTMQPVIVHHRASRDSEATVAVIGWKPSAQTVITLSVQEISHEEPIAQPLRNERSRTPIGR